MRILLCLLSVGLAFLAGCAASPPAPLSPQDQARIAVATEVYDHFVNDVAFGRYAEAASLFTDDARMTNHALMSAKGPNEIEAMLEKLGRHEVFFPGPTGTLAGGAVVLAGPCTRSLPGQRPFPGDPYPSRQGQNAECKATLRQEPDGRWRISYLETFEVARANEQNFASPQGDVSTSSTP